ncbi:winged helix-turn-helix transcriptional regulator [Qipengyuania marisflavi]|uniref:Transcriptional regulator n=1 Tax=Qipengyuania marisflavi TaxID=2486356 RepID=A0A5S3P6S5_9SPHN|nr:winged helix-turn-helix transcriptional regulator [Qipengyuania marisflavi]TMM48938.1 transcriptional regulator [Qipengyuania marisflavi]
MKSPKVTKATERAHGKWYDDACGTAFAMELVGERWSMLIIRELLLGGRRFSDLRTSLPGISAKILTERLASMEQAGVLNRRRLPSPGAVQIYELTEWGLQAEPAIQELGRWAALSHRHDPTLPLSPVSLMISLRTMFDRAKAAGITARIGFEIGGETFVAELKDGVLTNRRDQITGMEAVLRVPAAPVLAALIYGNVPPAALEQDAGLVIEGDRVLALRFTDIFELPEKIG